MWAVLLKYAHTLWLRVEAWVGIGVTKGPQNVSFCDANLIGGV
jgi:hypothetical protein